MIRHIFVSILWQRPQKPYKLFKIFFSYILLNFKIRHASTTWKELEPIGKSLGISQKSWKKKSRVYIGFGGRCLKITDRIAIQLVKIIGKKSRNVVYMYHYVLVANFISNYASQWIWL